MVQAVPKITQRKTIEVPLSSWRAWEAAARLAGVSRITFIRTVCDYAAKEISERILKDRQVEVDPSTLNL